MRILALETTERIGSLAALEDDRVLFERRLPSEQRSTTALAPGIQQLLAEVGWKPADVQLIAVPVGPGSFTGLRVGVTMAKTLAYAIGAEVLGLNTLEVIGMAAGPKVDRLQVVLDAQRQELFAGVLERDAGGVLRLQGEVQIVDNAAWLASLQAGDVVSGPALVKLADKIPAGVVALAMQTWTPMAGNVGRLACQEYTAGVRQDVFSLLPNYYRLSAAEEKRAAK